MTSPTPTPSAPPSPGPAAGGWRVRVDEILFFVLLLLSICGVAFTDLSEPSGLRFWLVMVPVFAAASIYSGWSKARRRGDSVSILLLRQGLHWAVLAVAMVLVSLLQRAGRLDGEAAGISALLALAVTAGLAGVHFDWLFGVLGLFLGLVVLFLALIEKYLWLLLVLAVLTALVAVGWRRRGAAPAAGGQA